LRLRLDDVDSRRVNTLKDSAGRIGLIALGMVASCRDRVLPTTPLGDLAAGWLHAHNQGDGHAMVHFTLVNRGTAPMNGAQVDSAVYDGVRFAKQVGPLEAVKLLQSTDTSVVVILRSNLGDEWKARFTSPLQPSRVKMLVHVSRGE
jgi:hypothetical protein